MAEYGLAGGGVATNPTCRTLISFAAGRSPKKLLGNHRSAVMKTVQSVRLPDPAAVEEITI